MIQREDQRAKRAKLELSSEEKHQRMIQEQAERAAAKTQTEASGPANEFKRSEDKKLEFNVSINTKKTSTTAPIVTAFENEDKTKRARENLTKKNKYDRKISKMRRHIYMHSWRCIRDYS